MNDKPFPEDLISGHLDGQLTPEQRAELDEALRDPELEGLASALGAQSDQLKALPKYELGADFADRLLADDRVAEALAAGERSVVGPERGGKKSGGARLAATAAAIASLAALVLISMFLIGPSLMSPEVAQKSAGVEVGRATDSLALKKDLEGVSEEAPGLPTAESDGDLPKFEAESELPSGKEEFDEEESVVISKDQQGRGDTRKVERFVPPSVARGRAQRKGVPAAETADSSDYQSDSMSDFADAAEAVDGKPQSRSSRGVATEQLGADAFKLKRMRSAGGKLAEEKRDGRFNEAEKLVAGGGGLGGGGGRGGQGGRLDQSEKGAVKEAVLDVRPLPGVLEVSFGTDASPIDKFKEVLERNSFQVELAPGQQLKQVEGLARAGVDDDLAGAADQELADQDLGNQAPVVFEVVGTAQQMAELVKDLNKGASVFRLSTESPGVESGKHPEVTPEFGVLKGVRDEAMAADGRSLGLKANTDDRNDKSNDASVVSRGIAKLVEQQQVSEVLGRKLKPIEQLSEDNKTTARYYGYFSKHSLGNAPAKYLFIVRRTPPEPKSDARDAEVAPIDGKDN